MKIAGRADVTADAWNQFVADSPTGWFFHTTWWLDYAVAYTPGCVDHSFVVTADTGEVLALVPLLSHGDQLVCGGQLLPAPLSVRSLDVTDTAQSEALARLGRAPFPVQLRPGIQPQQTMPHGYRVETRQTYVLDLSAPEAALWQGVRKSYKSLIHAAERKHQLAFGTGEAIVEAQKIHRAQAGRQTRSDETWKLMADWVDLGYARLIFAFAQTGPVGYAYVIWWKRWAYYGSAAYTVPNVSHALQWALIRHLKVDNVCCYELGSAAQDGDSEKAQGIAKFKGGFGGALWPQLVVHTAAA